MAGENKRTRRARRPGGLYTRLPPGRHGVPREQVAQHQRGRLQGAMVAAVADHGYAKTTIGELVDLASVSRSAFYEHYESKEECFLATHDEIARIVTEHVRNAFRSADGWRKRLHAAFEAFVEIVIAEPDAAYLAVVETQAVGPRALQHHQHVLDAFEEMVRQAFDRAPYGKAISDTTVKAVVTGIRRVVFQRLAEGHPELLPAAVEDLFSWALSYRAPRLRVPPDPPRGPAIVTSRPTSTRRTSGVSKSVGERATLSHRDRIVNAVTQLASQRGYAAITIPDISATAGISNQTFYEIFRGKQQAFLVAYDEVSQRGLDATLTAYREATSWPAAVHSSIETLLEFISSEPAFARLVFFEVFAAGAAGRERGERRMEAFIATLSPGLQMGAEPPSSVQVDAMAGGLWGVIQYEITQGRVASLKQLTPSLTYVALTPFLGPQEAAKIARNKAG